MIRIKQLYRLDVLFLFNSWSYSCYTLRIIQVYTASYFSSSLCCSAGDPFQRCYTICKTSPASICHLDTYASWIAHTYIYVSIIVCLDQEGVHNGEWVWRHRRRTTSNNHCWKGERIHAALLLGSKMFSWPIPITFNCNNLISDIVENIFFVPTIILRHNIS